MSKRWIVGALAGLILSPATAQAAGSPGIYSRVLHAYSLSSSGSVPACKFTSQQLSSALGSVDTYGQQYFADFIAAIQTALAARAAGACSGHRRIISGAGGNGTGGPRLPASLTAASSSGVPAPLLVLGIAAAVLAIAAALVVVLGQSAALAQWRHSWAEARYRLGGRWPAPPPRRRG